MILAEVKEKRKYISPVFELTDWASLSPYYEALKEFPIHSKEQLEEFIARYDELSRVVSESFAWVYIRMTCNTNDKEIAEKYQYLVSEILPKVSQEEHVLNTKYYESPFRKLLNAEKYFTFDRGIAKEIELFRQENEELLGKARLKSQEYDQIVANFTILHEGKTYTLQQAALFLEEPNRTLREKVWCKIQQARSAKENAIDSILTELIQLRHQIAQNAGYDTFTQYMFKKLGRFDYTYEDCLKFHEGIEKVIKPVYEQIQQTRKKRLKLDNLRPWDLSVDIFHQSPLRPFENASELTEKIILLFDQMKPELGQMVRKLQAMGHLDLDSREGKTPGGYNYPLAETGVPFIFMNAVGTHGDLITMIHECGHAFHSFLTNSLELLAFKDVPSEVAELASMGMELISMPFWSVFYPDNASLYRAYYEQLTRCVAVLPWIATIDAFQAWLYDNPTANPEQRKQQWINLYYRFHGNQVDWSGFEHFLAILWQKQGHIFDVPFYYIEYGMAQLGALQLWKNAQENHEATLHHYLNALQLGYTKTIPQIYQTAQVSFDFSPQMLQQLADLLIKELNALEQKI